MHVEARGEARHGIGVGPPEAVDGLASIADGDEALLAYDEGEHGVVKAGKVLGLVYEGKGVLDEWGAETGRHVDLVIEVYGALECEANGLVEGSSYDSTLIKGKFLVKACEEASVGDEGSAVLVTFGNPTAAFGMGDEFEEVGEAFVEGFLYVLTFVLDDAGKYVVVFLGVYAKPNSAKLLRPCTVAEGVEGRGDAVRRKLALHLVRDLFVEGEGKDSGSGHCLVVREHEEGGSFGCSGKG